MGLLTVNDFKSLRRSDISGNNSHSVATHGSDERKIKNLDSSHEGQRTRKYGFFYTLPPPKNTNKNK